MARFRITCSSGTYVRGIVHEMGEQLGTGALTLEILRTRVGDYLLKDAKSV
jgi:tRNA pseudouridine55 synthase